MRSVYTVLTVLAALTSLIHAQYDDQADAVYGQDDGLVWYDVSPEAAADDSTVVWTYYYTEDASTQDYTPEVETQDYAAPAADYAAQDEQAQDYVAPATYEQPAKQRSHRAQKYSDNHHGVQGHPDNDHDAQGYSDSHYDVQGHPDSDYHAQNYSDNHKPRRPTRSHGDNDHHQQHKGRTYGDVDNAHNRRHRGHAKKSRDSNSPYATTQQYGDRLPYHRNAPAPKHKKRPVYGKSKRRPKRRPRKRRVDVDTVDNVDNNEGASVDDTDATVDVKVDTGADKDTDTSTDADVSDASADKDTTESADEDVAAEADLDAASVPANEDDVDLDLASKDITNELNALGL